MRKTNSPVDLHLAWKGNFREASSTLSTTKMKVALWAVFYFLTPLFWKTASEVQAQNAYITNFGNDTMKVVNVNTDSITANIKLGHSPFGVAVRQGGGKIYVSNDSAGTVNCISILTNLVTDTIAVGSQPRGISFSPDGTKIYVLNYGSNTVNVIDVSTNTVTDTIAVGNHPYGLCFSLDGSKLFVTNEQDSSVNVINTTTLSVIDTIAVGLLPQSIARSLAGDKMYVVNNGSNSISVIDTVNYSVVDTILVGQSPKVICFNPDSTHAYVTNAVSNDVHVIAVSSNTVLDTIPVGVNPIGMSVTSNGTKLYVLNYGSNSLNVISTDSNLVTDTIFGFNAPIAFGNFICLKPIHDQSNIGAGGSGGSGGSGISGSTIISSGIVGQSFTCGVEGSLSQVDVSLRFTPSCPGVAYENVTIKVYNGAGTSGNLLGTSDVVAVSNSSYFSIHSFMFTVPVAMGQGNVYTIRAVKSSSACSSDEVRWSFTGNNYPNGTAFFNNVADVNYDYHFDTYMVPPAPVVNIPDANFKLALLGNAQINLNSDNQIQISEAVQYTGSLNLQGLNISNLKGIEAFTALTSLNCSNNNLTYLDVSSNTSLTNLNCRHNSLTSLNIKNGNNANMTMNSQFNPALSCIQVDNVTNATNYNGVTFFKPTTASYNSVCALTWYLDADADGYYVSSQESEISPGVGYTSTLPANGSGDCNDNDINAHALPVASVISASGPLTFCAGGSVTLSGNTVGLWSNGSPASTINATTSGTYFVTNSNSCGNANSNSIVVTVNTVTPSITGASSFCPSNTATLATSGSYNSYLWSTGETTPSIVITSPNTYGVTVVDGNNCSASTNILVSSCTTTVPDTKLRTVHCGKQNLMPNSQLACNPVAGATNYEFEISDLNSNLVATKITSCIYFAPGLCSPALQWNTQYNCRVRAKVAGTWGNFSDVCIIGMAPDPAVAGVPNSKLDNKSCDKLNLSPTSSIGCVQIPMCTGYQFELTDNTTGQVTVKNTSIRYLPLSSLSPAIDASHTYSVRVKGRQYLTWGNFSDVCTIGFTPSVVARVGMSEESEEVTEATADEETEVINLDSENELYVISDAQLTAYPNPMVNEATISISHSNATDVYITITDVLGKTVYRSKQENPNTNILLTDQEIKSKGIYIVTATFSNGETKSIRITK